MTEYSNMAFKIKDCTLITRMAGVKEALNLRELEERVRICPEECLFHHFSETVIRPTFDYPDYPNDFSLWAGFQLRDPILAERLALLNPYKCENFEELRIQLINILEERLSEIEYIPWAPKGRAFQFMQAATVVFYTGVTLVSPDDFYQQISQMSLGSIYYHFVEARRRTETKTDDFTAWLMEFDNVDNIVSAMNEIDFYYLSLQELRNLLIDIVNEIN